MAFSIAIYEELAELSRQMLDATREGDSAEICRISLCVKALRSEIVEQGFPCGATECIRTYRNALLHRILDNDAQIRRLTSPLPPFVDAVLTAGAPNVRRGDIAAHLD